MSGVATDKATPRKEKAKNWKRHWKNWLDFILIFSVSDILEGKCLYRKKGGLGVFIQKSCPKLCVLGILYAL